MKKIAATHFVSGNRPPACFSLGCLSKYRSVGMGVLLLLILALLLPGHAVGQVPVAASPPLEVISNASAAMVLPRVSPSEYPTTADYQVQQIDSQIEQVWAEYELKPSAPATEGEWCRRLFLDLLGRVPTVAELTTFLDDRDKLKRKHLVDRLLYDDEYTEDLARNWTTVWTNLLIGRTGGNGNNSLISREGMQKYLRDSFAREKPYNQMVTELVTATGTTRPGGENFNGATNFLIDKVNDEEGAQATAATTRIFLGMQVQCTQCHNHPFNDWKQQKYWEMNAFFRQTRAFGRRRDNAVTDVPAELRDQDFAGESGENPDEAELFFEQRNGLVTVAYPVFVDGREIARSGYVNVVNRREKLAELIVASPNFTRAIANQMWAHFLGYGFTTPVNDLGPHNVPSNPELLDYLAQEFRKSEFDLRSLMSWIVLSRPYSLSSKRNRSNEIDDPMLGEPPKFSNFYLRQMEAEQLYESLLVATEASFSGSYESQEREKNRWLQQFNTAFGNDEGQESTNFNGTIPQILMMFNGELVKKATRTEKGTLIQRLVAADLRFDKKAQHLFLAGLSRKPIGKERELVKAIYRAHPNDPAEALRDIWWVILNTNEFIFNH